MQGKHWAIATAFPPPPSQPRWSIPVNSSTPPTHRIQGGQQTTEWSTRNSGGRVRTVPPGCAGGPGAARAALPEPGVPVPRKFKGRSSQAPGPMPLPGGGSAAPAEGPRGPPRLAEDGSSSPHTPRPPRRGRAGPTRSSPSPGGRPCPPPPPRAARSARGGDNRHDDFTLQQCEEQRGTPPTSPRPPGRSRALSPQARAPAQRRLRLGGSAPPLTRRHAQGGGRRRRPEPGDAATAGPLSAPAPPRTHPRYL